MIGTGLQKFRADPERLRDSEVGDGRAEADIQKTQKADRVGGLGSGQGSSAEEIVEPEPSNFQ